MECEFINWKQKGGLRKGPEQQKLYAKFANISYQDGLEARKKKLDDYGFSKDGWKIDEKLTNDDMATLYNDKTKEVVYSVSGTRLDKKHGFKDVFSDIGIMAGVSSLGKRTNQVHNVVKKGQSKYKDYKPVLAGHSLGAKISKNVSEKTNIPAVVYNMGSSPASIITDRLAKAVGRRKKSDITHYTTRGDVISLSERLLGDTKTKIVKKTRKDKGAHSLAQFGAGKNKWMEHVKKVRAENKDMKYIDVLKLASTSYKS